MRLQNSSIMEGQQLQENDITTLDYIPGFMRDFNDISFNTTSSSKKRPWPFGIDNLQSSVESPSSPSTTIPTGALHLLGSLRSSNDRAPHYDQFYSSGQYILFDVSLVGDYFELLYSGQKFARLNKNFCSEVRRLTPFGVKFQAYLSKSDWESLFPVQSNHRIGPARPFDVEVNVYSFKHHADQIGDILSQTGVFLQDPTYGLDEVPYHNPQLLEIRGVEKRQEEALDNVSDTSASNPISFGSVMEQEKTDPERQRNTTEIVDSILDSLSHNNILQEVSTDQNRIKAKLLPHQMKAIDFIRQRESSEMPASLCLWKEHQAMGEEICFRHVLTAAKRPRREEAKETKGGIIADDMGLGKILVILSAIASSMKNATDFVSNYAKDLSTSSKCQHASRATLVLAPSTPHEIRNRSTKQFQAVDRLTAQHRWCLTGTPIQNSLEDLGALISFLKVPILDKPQTFRTYIIAPTTSKTKLRYQNLQMLLQTVCLRRTKDIIGLPNAVPENRLVRLSDRERFEYNELFQRFREYVQMAVSGHRSRVSATVLHSIHELRLFCNNGLRKAATGILEADDELFSLLQLRDMNLCAHCGVCIFSIDEASGGIFMANCKHLVCHGCHPQCYTPRKGCLLCYKGHAPVRPSEDSMLALPPESTYSQQPVTEFSSKLLALQKDLQSDMGSKCIVFSSWKKTLDLAAVLLKSTGLHYNLIHGGLGLKIRLKVLDEFRSPKGPNILLMTLGTGAVGLNLAVATRIYILEPQWNPSIELQAMARAQRIGQTKQVTAIRYIVENTIESQQSNVLNKQMKKAALARDGFGREKFEESLQYFHLPLDQ
ncbi:hypothetical protein CJF31_00011242 [Rutstroemia sp. NJR-2017a BVV2]|nr:hypothetical protein CJF31_00011242 [Rutstroemia sp. NJR-2017a BVV2]